MSEQLIVGRQTRIGELLEAIKLQDRKINLDTISDLTADLFDAMTGGDFQVVGRTADLDRARSVQDVGAEMNGLLYQSLNLRVGSQLQGLLRDVGTFVNNRKRGPTHI